MAEDISKTALDIIKLSPRWLAAPLLALAVLIFAPAAILTSLGLDQFVASYRGYIGFAFLLALSLFFVGVVASAAGALVAIVRDAHLKSRRRARMKERLLNLTEAEKQILRYHTSEQTRTNYLRIDDGVVMGLARLGIIYQAASLGDVVDGFAFNISETALEMLAEHPEALVGSTVEAMTHKSPWY